MKFAETYKVVPVMASDDINAGVDTDSINVSKVFNVTYLFTFGTLVGDAVLTVAAGATDGAKTETGLTFRYALGSADIGSANCDVLGTDTEATTLTLTAATYSDRLLVIEVPVDRIGRELDLNTYDWLTVSLSDAADSGSADCIAICEPRYTKAQSASVLA